MLISTLTITSFAISENNKKNNEYTEEVTKTFPVEISETEVLKRIKKLNKLLGGKYFTVNQESCGSETSHGCSNCGMLDVVDTKWFQKTVGFSPVDRDYYPHHYFAGHKYTWGMSCCGFAGYAGWYIYAQKETDNVVFNSKGTYFFNEKNADKYLKPGDIIRLDSRHSAVYISHNEEGVEVLDCNWRTDGTNCEVRKHIIEYSNYSLMGVSRALNNKGESKLRVKLVNPEVPEQNITIPFRKGESVPVEEYSMSKVGHYQVGWAKKPNKSKVKYDIDCEFDKAITLYPVWKEYDNKRLVVVQIMEPKNNLLFNTRTEFAKIIGELPVGTQENFDTAIPKTTILSSKQIDACVNGNEKNKKYIVVFTKVKRNKAEVLFIRYEDEFDYEKFGVSSLQNKK
ncbi:MAG: hypothetical protein UGF89_00280 [Acutalibacteraceae bacterium]|nr:hypothetical protein [Acutalibacteraceae bacterium]